MKLTHKLTIFLIAFCLSIASLTAFAQAQGNGDEDGGGGGPFLLLLAEDRATGDGGDPRDNDGRDSRDGNDGGDDNGDNGTNRTPVGGGDPTDPSDPGQGGNGEPSDPADPPVETDPAPTYQAPAVGNQIMPARLPNTGTSVNQIAISTGFAIFLLLSVAILNRQRF